MVDRVDSVDNFVVRVDSVDNFVVKTVASGGATPSLIDLVLHGAKKLSPKRWARLKAEIDGPTVLPGDVKAVIREWCAGRCANKTKSAMPDGLGEGIGPVDDDWHEKQSENYELVDSALRSLGNTELLCALILHRYWLHFEVSTFRMSGNPQVGIQGYNRPTAAEFSHSRTALEMGIVRETSGVIAAIVKCELLAGCEIFSLSCFFAACLPVSGRFGSSQVIQDVPAQILAFGYRSEEEFLEAQLSRFEGLVRGRLQDRALDRWKAENKKKEERQRVEAGKVGAEKRWKKV